MYLKNINLGKEFDNKINEIDLLITLGHLNEIDKWIVLAANDASTSLHFKRLLKRVLKSHNPKTLEQISKLAYNKYPEDELVLSTYIYVLLNSNKIEEASLILDNQNKQIIHENILIETNIKNKNYDETDNLLYKGVYEKNALIYRKLYNLTNNKKFLLNAVLVNLEAGNIQSADTILEGIVFDDSKFKKLQFFIKYDSAKFDIALELLNLFDYGFSIQEIQLLRIDIYIRQGKYGKAEILIREFLHIYPDYSWIPYYNFVWLNTVLTISESKLLIEAGLKKYPDNRELMLVTMDYYLENNMNEMALVILREYMNNFHSDNELEIILKEIEGVKKPEYIVNLIRNLVNQNPKNISAARYLAMNIFMNDDIMHLQNYLDQIEKEGKTGWINFFRALILVKNGDMELAIKEFEYSYELENHWETLYNLAVIFEFTNHYQDAIVYYQNAENYVANNKNSNVIKSLIRTSLASFLYDIKEYEHSYREVRNALDLDIYNLKANFLLKKLELLTF